MSKQARGSVNSVNSVNSCNEGASYTCRHLTLPQHDISLTVFGLIYDSVMSQNEDYWLTFTLSSGSHDCQCEITRLLIVFLWLIFAYIKGPIL